MAERHFTNFDDAKKAIERDLKARDSRVHKAVVKAGKDTTRSVVQNIPRAFGELADSVDMRVLGRGYIEVEVNAPYAAAVEAGSRPHRPPLEPLIRWVALRGMQGLTEKGNVRRESWRTAAKKGGFAVDAMRASRVIARQLQKKLGRTGAAAWHYKAKMGIDADVMGADPAVVSVARAIQAKIAKRGTKPRRYVMGTVPDAERWLKQYVEEALPDK